MLQKSVHHAPPHIRLCGLQHLGDGLSQPGIGGDFALQLVAPRPHESLLCKKPDWSLEKLTSNVKGRSVSLNMFNANNGYTVDNY
jgi:hypothetical protein